MHVEIADGPGPSDAVRVLEVQGIGMIVRTITSCLGPLTGASGCRGAALGRGLEGEDRAEGPEARWVLIEKLAEA